MSDNKIGKGSNPRPIPKYKEYLNNWDEIDWSGGNKEKSENKTCIGCGKEIELGKEYCGECVIKDVI